jgi:hypothetical protein
MWNQHKCAAFVAALSFGVIATMASPRGLLAVLLRHLASGRHLPGDEIERARVAAGGVLNRRDG